MTYPNIYYIDKATEKLTRLTSNSVNEIVLGLILNYG